MKFHKIFNNWLQVIFCACFLSTPLFTNAYQLYGKITDEKNNPVQNASIFIENTTYGVASNLKGEYFLELKNGKHRIVFQALGFAKKAIDIVINDRNKILDVLLIEEPLLLDEINIAAEKKDPAYAIIEKAIENRNKYLKQIESYSCETYLKASLEKEKKVDLEDVDSTKVITYTDSSGKTGAITKEKMNFVEAYSTVYFKYPGLIKEVRTAYRDLAEKRKSNVQLSISFDEEERYDATFDNPNLFKLNVSDAIFNFYETTMFLPDLSEIPLISPIGALALISYKYKLIEKFLTEDGYWVNKIEVIPRRKDGALFSGIIFIIDDLWCIKAVDMEVNPAALNIYDKFRMLIEYQSYGDTAWMAKREEFFYNTKEGKVLNIGNTLLVNNNYVLNPKMPANFFKNELRSTTDEAFDRDTLFWAQVRPVTLKGKELEFIRLQDSIQYYQKSPEYLHKQDSIFNRINLLKTIFDGFGYTNSFKKKTIYMYGLIQMINPLGIGGYRQRLSGNYSKEWSKAHKFIIEPSIDYGIVNKDVKGSVSASFRYLPKKFARFYIDGGNTYDMINTVESLSYVFSRGNYVNYKYITLGHSFEIINGLFFEVEADYSEVHSIEKLKLEKWSGKMFGESNTPRSFKHYGEFIIDFYLKYTPFQKFFTEPYKKIIVGSRYPTFRLNYSKGIKNIMRSGVDFDFFEFRIEDKMKISTLGESKWQINTGKFLRSDSTQLTDLKFFRGSDPYYYSHPLKSFQLLGRSINTKNEYIEAHYIHHFNEVLLNKIPLLRKLRLENVIGGGVLYVKDDNFRHAETFVGLERKFRIRRQLFRFGCYYVTSDNNFSKLEGEFKFGIDFFNSFTNSWSY